MEGTMKQLSCEKEIYGSVLVVDDVETNLIVTRGLLKPYSLQVDLVKSGMDAIRKISDGRIYDVILMDYMMPGLNGVETMEILRNMGYDYPIVALVASDLYWNAGVLFGNGFDDVVSKPIDMRQLDLVLGKYIYDKHTGTSDKAGI